SPPLFLSFFPSLAFISSVTHQKKRSFFVLFHSVERGGKEGRAHIIDAPRKKPSYGMWRRPSDGVALILLLLANGAAAAVFSEGGGSGEKKEAEEGRFQQAESAMDEHLKQQYLDYLARAQAQAAEEDAEREEQEKAMADEILREAQLEALMAEMARAGGAGGSGPAMYEDDGEPMMEEDQKEVVPREVAPLEEEKIAVAPEVAKEAPKQEELIDESAESQPTDKAPTMQKKGQSEFVSFVDPDPQASKLIKSVPSVGKRTIEQVRIQNANKGGHLLFLAVGCVMAVGMVAALVGGLIRYRKNREEPDDQEYAPYAGTGPRNVKKPIKGEKGDETLAYKAQLHHYQQAKQKIICGEDNAGVAGDSEDETDEIDDENNFSVYECPGLAPTGDIEVHNPNFAADRP
ncbi:hypothetical protein PENTCL1PPCAC_25576, partial [Pristionchus entomophagus]